MKKVIFTLALAGTFVAATAQDIMPKAGDYALGVNASPFLTYIGSMFTAGTNTAPSFNSQSPLTINGKYFSADNRAWRASLTLGITNTTAESPNFTDPTKTNETQSSSATIGVGVGYEYKRVSGKRMVFSYGPQIGIGTFAHPAGKVEITNGADANLNTTSEGGNTLSLGLGGFAGVEYFILPKMSIGAEFNASLNYYGTSERTTKTGTAASTIVSGKASGFGFGNYLTASGFADGTQIGSLNLTFYF